MKVLFLSMHYRPEPCDTRTSQLAKAFAALGHKSTVLTSFPNYPFGKIYPGYKQKIVQKELVDGVDVVRVPMIPDHSRSARKRAVSYLSFGATAAFIGAFVTRRPELLWIHHPPLGTGIAGYVLATLKRVPYVYEIHDLWPETLTSTGMVKEGRITRAIRSVCNFLHKRATAVVVTSWGTKAHLVSQGLAEEKVHVLPQWADEEAFQATHKDEAFGKEHGLLGKFNIVFTGNMGVAQHLETVIQAAAKVQDLSDVQIVMVGAGVELDRLKEVAEAKGLQNVVFLGQHPPKTMPSFLAWADGLLVHLKKDPLFAITIPHKTQVYMASGKPILCGVEGDAARMVSSADAGLCFAPEDAEAMASAIRQLHAMTLEERSALGRNAAKGYAENYSQAALVERYEALFESVISTRHARSFRPWPHSHKSA